MPTELLKFDTHIHTNASPCSSNKPERVVDKAVQAGLGEIVIKDHDRISGVLKAFEYNKPDQTGLIINPGLEVTTDCGEIGIDFANFEELERILELKEDGITSFRRLIELCMEIQYEDDSTLLKDLHHPYDFANPKRGFNFDKAQVEMGLSNIKEVMDLFDFTEINCSSTNIREVQFAVKLATQYMIPIVRSTDSHFIPQIGRYYSTTLKSSARNAIISGDLDNYPANTPRPMQFVRSVNYSRARYYRLRSWLLKKYRKSFGDFK
ncbi:PHP domain-containing protein [Candidatus Peregrinibacteria bacterium]|nr:PHP domain-containing protein [Candidatus Peregrinibacteria bacterium]